MLGLVYSLQVWRQICLIFLIAINPRNSLRSSWNQWVTPVYNDLCTSECECIFLNDGVIGTFVATPCWPMRINRVGMQILFLVARHLYHQSSRFCFATWMVHSKDSTKWQFNMDIYSPCSPVQGVLSSSLFNCINCHSCHSQYCLCS